MRKLLFLSAILFPVAAQAQVACPTVTSTTVYTVAQWNACFGSLGASANGVFTNPTLTNPTISGGAITATSVTPAGRWVKSWSTACSI